MGRRRCEGGGGGGGVCVCVCACVCVKRTRGGVDMGQLRK